MPIRAGRCCAGRRSGSRAALPFFSQIGWLTALVDCVFSPCSRLRAARVVAGRNWGISRGLLSSACCWRAISRFISKRISHGLPIHGIRIGIAVVVLLISLIGGRIIPSFTRNWLAGESGQLPAPFGRFDMPRRRITALILLLWLYVAAADYRRAAASSRRTWCG